MAEPVIEIATLRFVRQCLKQMRHLVPPFNGRILVPLHNNKTLNVKQNLIPPSNTELCICGKKYTYKYTYKCISASAQERPFSQTRQFVRCSLVCESGVEVEPGENVAKCPGS
jgi:hypothetical protein